MNSQAVIVITVIDGLVEIKVEGSGLALDIAESLFDDNEEGGNV